MTASHADILLQADKINTGYGRVDVVHGVSLTVRRGQIIAIIRQWTKVRSTCPRPRLRGRTGSRFSSSSPGRLRFDLSVTSTGFPVSATHRNSFGRPGQPPIGSRRAGSAHQHQLRIYHHSQLITHCQIQY